jgi:phage terminase large subunit-like protein
VKHESGGISVVQFKSYDQGREAFQGTEQDIIWLDEEPPMDVYTECLLRTMTNDGLVMLTFTPLRGMSEVVLAFMPGGAMPEKQDGPKAVVSATWDDVPHLSEQAKEDLWDAFLPSSGTRAARACRSSAPAHLPGAGVRLRLRALRNPQALAARLRPGRRVEPTAAIFGAYDKETDTGYLYSEHYQGEVSPRCTRRPSSRAAR